MSRRRHVLGTLVATATVLAGVPTGVQAGERHRPVAARGFDLQAHRGGLGLRVETTLASLGNALQLGVGTLELDVQITSDRQAVVTHDRRISGTKCVDTGPATPGDTGFPYVGRYVNTLTLAQVRTLDCGSRTLADKPGQLAVPGARMPPLREVFALVKRYGANDVTLNVETKVEAGAPTETAPREQFVRVTAAEVRAAGSDQGDQDLRRPHLLAGARLSAERHGHRPRLPAVRDEAARRARAAPRRQGRAVDGGRRTDHGKAAGRRGGRHHHRLPGPAAYAARAAADRAAPGIRGAVRHPGAPGR
jgi:hypothetical protein